jgi:hypothetical protein
MPGDETPAIGVAADGEHEAPSPGRLRAAAAVGLVVGAAAAVAVDAHQSVALVVGDRRSRAVHRQQREVRPEPVPLRVGVGEQTTLQQPIRRGLDAGHQVAGRERGLLDLGEHVGRVAIEHEAPDRDPRVVRVAPDHGHVERVVAVGVGVGHRHHLHADLPLGRAAALQVLVQVARRMVGVAARQRGRRRTAQRAHAGLGPEVVLHEDTRAGRVHPRERVHAEAVHVPVRRRRAAVAEQHGDHVRRLGRVREEVPERVGVLESGRRVALVRVHHVGELHRVADEEHRQVVADEVVVALLRVELDGEAAWVAFAVGRAALAADGREAHQRRGAAPLLAEHVRLAEPAHVLRALEEAERAGTLGVHDPLGDTLAIEVGELLDQLHVLQQHRTAVAGGQRAGVVGDRRALVGGEVVLGHGTGSWVAVVGAPHHRGPSAGDQGLRRTGYWRRGCQFAAPGEQ